MVVLVLFGFEEVSFVGEDVSKDKFSYGETETSSETCDFYVVDGVGCCC